MKRLRFSVVAWFMVGLVAGMAWAAAESSGVVPVEASESLPRKGNLETTRYKVTDQEKPFLAKVTEEAPNLWGAVDDVPPAGAEAGTRPAKDAKGPAKAYTLAGQSGKYVGWFGIVRSMTWDEKAKTTALLLQHCYVDGFMDAHMQTVSCFGAGDFSVTLPQKLDGVDRLSLMRVYGKASVDVAGKPVVTAEYVRTWTWGQFTFMNYGVDHSNPEWVKLRKVAADNIYKPYPDTAFYEERLGKK